MARRSVALRRHMTQDRRSTLAVAFWGVGVALGLLGSASAVVWALGVVL